MAGNLPMFLRGEKCLMVELAPTDVHRSVLEALPLGVYLVNREGKVIVWTAGAEQLTGYLRQDILGRLRESDLIEPKQRDEAPDLFGATTHAQSGSPAATFASLQCKNGHYLAVQLRSIALRDDAGKFLGTVRIFEPSSSPKPSDRRQNKLGAYGCLDPVTGVLNHSMIQAHVKESLNLHALYPVPFCLMCYEIDDLSKLARRYGQAAADAALRVVASTFETGLRPTDFLGRWLGQEFLTILPECGESDLIEVGERLRMLVQHCDLEWWGDTLHLTVSIGATVAHDNDSVSSLIGRAEQGLRKSSSAGGNRVTVVLE
jgi:diguanylate cyclase (GGDEF)-like protein/PAS domain S-box-containing protein